MPTAALTLPIAGLGLSLLSLLIVGGVIGLAVTFVLAKMFRRR